MYNVLVVDDEQQMRNLIEMFLTNANFTVFKAQNSAEAYAVLREQPVDLVLLDIMMPGEDGFAVCEKILAAQEKPIIFLSALDDHENKVRGLMLGADDYIAKPFDASELIARIHTVLRRYQKTAQPEQELLRIGELTVDEESRKVYIGEQLIVLTFKEFEILRLFMKNPYKVYSRNQLLALIWESDYAGGTRTVDTHIKTLRIKLSKIKQEIGDQIQTVWGIGYRFEPKQ